MLTSTAPQGTEDAENSCLTAFDLWLWAIFWSWNHYPTPAICVCLLQAHALTEVSRKIFPSLLISTFKHELLIAVSILTSLTSAHLWKLHSYFITIVQGNNQHRVTYVTPGYAYKLKSWKHNGFALQFSGKWLMVAALQHSGTYLLLRRQKPPEQACNCSTHNLSYTRTGSQNTACWDEFRTIQVAILVGN